MWVKFPVVVAVAEPTSERRQVAGASVVIWTTTPWTIPGNRAISFSPKIDYGLYEVVDAPIGQLGEAGRPFRAGRQARGRGVPPGAGDRVQEAQERSGGAIWPALVCEHPLKAFQQGLRFQGAAACRRSCHRRYRHGLRAHCARARPRRLRHLDRECARARRRAASTPPFPTRSTPTAASPSRRPASPASACSPTRARRATPTRR